MSEGIFIFLVFINLVKIYFKNGEKAKFYLLSCASAICTIQAIQKIGMKIHVLSFVSLQ